VKVAWQKTRWAEAQVFEPEAGAREAIVFCPGFPGMGAAIFEQRHAAALVAEGYAVYVIHHKGTRLNRALSASSVNNGWRWQQALEAGETHLGGGPVRMEELLDEPQGVLKDMEGLYESIHVVGNSFGALAALKSLTEEGAAIDSVRSIVLLAGAQGVDDGTDECVMNRVWKAAYMELPAITDQIEVADTQNAIETLRDIYNALPGRVLKNLPESIPLFYVVVEKDEILRLQDTLDFQKAIEGRGEIIMDYDEGWPSHGLTPHYTANYRTSSLLKLIRG